MPSKKKFIDKKNAVTFVLGHRSQKDPLIADENAPQNVLIPIDQVPSTVPGTSKGPSSASKVDKSKQKEEQTKYGIYFDDDYDYLQHLRGSEDMGGIDWDFCERLAAPKLKADEKEKPTGIQFKDAKLQLPSSVFESEHREEVGLLNKAAPISGPRPNLDPDVVAAMDEDFDFDNPDNELEDNFMELANGEGVDGEYDDDDEDYEDEEEDEEVDSDEELDSLGSLDGPQYTFADEETKSKFTNYSMSSSSVYRNKQLALVDDQFEKMFEAYDDTEIGALDCDEIEGHLDPQSEMLLKAADEFDRDRRKEQIVNEKISQLALRDESDTDSDIESEEDAPKEKWDCESILSTYSTTRNRPKLLKELPKNKIKVNSRGMPVGELGKGLTAAKLKDLDAEYDREMGAQPRPVKSFMSGATSIRDRNETSQERAERKKVVREYRKERRQEKKANTTAFKEEKGRQERIRLNAKSNLQGLKL